jgi:F0F1-type ATP synthase membrane subunit b/b'
VTQEFERLPELRGRALMRKLSGASSKLALIALLLLCWWLWSTRLQVLAEKAQRVSRAEFFREEAQKTAEQLQAKLNAAALKIDGYEREVAQLKERAAAPAPKPITKPAPLKRKRVKRKICH